MGIGDWGLGPIPNPQSPIPKLNLNRIFHLIMGKTTENEFLIPFKKEQILEPPTDSRIYIHQLIDLEQVADSEINEMLKTLYETVTSNCLDIVDQTNLQTLFSGL